MRRGWVAFLLTLVAAIPASTVTTRAQATTTVERSTEPFVFDSVNPCTGDPVLLTGELEVTTRITVDDGGTTHVAYNLVPSQVRGEDADGISYMAVGGQREHVKFENEPFPFVATFTDTFNLISAGGVANFTATTLFHVTVTSDGTITADVARVSDACHG